MIDHLGPYRILKRLGSGGMGEVYLAEDERLRRKVALKVLAAQHAEDSESQKRLRREAQAAARLDHPNICTVYEVGEWERGTYIAMQAVEGHTLSELMEKGRFTVSEVLNVGLQVADALQEAHDKGILHRDLKPHNLMLTPKGQVKVLDFGLAKPLTKQALGESLTSGVGMTIGTVPYMSPEQVRGEDLDARSDLFSLGLVLYELATGQRAFHAESAVEVMAAILREEPDHMRNEDGAIHPALRSILARLLEKDRAFRYGSAQALKEDLVKLRLAISAKGASHELPTAQIPLPLRFRRWMRRIPRWAMASGFAGLLLGAGIAGWALRRPARLESLAVLPIANATGDAEVEYIADGLTEDLIQHLSRTPELRVIARTSILRYKGRDVDPKAVAAELGVRTLLTGRLVKRGGEVTLNFELLDAQEQRHVWGEQIPKALDDLQGTRAAVATQVARKMGATPAAAPQRVDDQAYNLYLQGRFYADRWTPQDVDKALSYFDQALVKDPKFAMAHVGKAYAYWSLSNTFRPSREMMPKVGASAQKALDLNPDLAEAYALRGATTFFHRFDSRSAENDFKKALKINQGSAFCYEVYGHFLIFLGRVQEAEHHLSSTIKLDPMSPKAWFFLSLAQNTRREFNISLASANKAISIDPGFWPAHLMVACNEHRLGNLESAIRSADTAAASGSNYALAIKGRILALGRRTDEAKSIASFLQSEKATQNGYVSPIHLALVFAPLGDQKKTIHLLEKALRDQEEEIVSLRWIDHWREIREDPAYQSLLAKIPG